MTHLTHTRHAINLHDGDRYEKLATIHLEDSNEAIKWSRLLGSSLELNNVLISMVATFEGDRQNNGIYLKAVELLEKINNN